MSSTTWKFSTAWSLNESGSVVLYVATPDPARAIHEANETGLVSASPLAPNDPVASMLRERAASPPPPAPAGPTRRRSRLAAAPPPAPDAPVFVVAVAAQDFEAFVRWFNDDYQPRYFPRPEDVVDVLTEAVPYEVLPWSGMSSL